MVRSAPSTIIRASPGLLEAQEQLLDSLNTQARREGRQGLTHLLPAAGEPNHEHHPCGSPRWSSVRSKSDPSAPSELVVYTPMSDWKYRG